MLKYLKYLLEPYTKPFLKACATTGIITLLWYASEYEQFGELQWDRKCDNLVTLLYFLALLYAFSQKH